MLHHHHVVRFLPYRPEDLFRLVADVRCYPDFVPWVKAVRTGVRRQETAAVSVVDAEATVGFSVLKERFATQVRQDVEAHTIRVSLISGPFKTLQNTWRFDETGDGTEVVFDIDFEFRSPLLETLLRANFALAVDRLINCFEGRAQALYGTAVASA